MMLQREGLPEEGELLLCTVTNIQYHSVFAKLDEFSNKTGMIHISEVAPGRIRNIREYVREGKKVVCKVLRIHRDRGHIDLSLRRVTDGQKRVKINQIKQEQKAEKIVEIVAKEVKSDAKKIFRKLADQFINDYGTIYTPFENVVKGEDEVKNWGLTDDETKALDVAIRLRIKEAEVQISGEFRLKSTESDGVGVVKTALLAAEKEGGENTKIHYLGAGRYGVLVKASDYKEAEAIVKKVTDAALTLMKNKGSGEFIRHEK